MYTQFIVENTWLSCQISRVLPHSTAPNSLFPVRSEKVKKGALRFCAHLSLWLLSFNVPEYRPLQTCFNVEMPSSLIFEPLAFGRDRTLNSQYFTYNHGYPCCSLPTLTLITAVLFTQDNIIILSIAKHFFSLDNPEVG